MFRAQMSKILLQQNRPEAAPDDVHANVGFCRRSGSVASATDSALMTHLGLPGAKFAVLQTQLLLW
jgi:hypothetical protein